VDFRKTFRSRVIASFAHHDYCRAIHTMKKYMFPSCFWSENVIEMCVDVSLQVSCGKT